MRARYVENDAKKLRPALMVKCRPGSRAAYGEKERVILEALWSAKVLGVQLHAELIPAAVMMG
jgi:hypothetical protein